MQEIVEPHDEKGLEMRQHDICPPPPHFSNQISQPANYPTSQLANLRFCLVGLSCDAGLEPQPRAQK